MFRWLTERRRRRILATPFPTHWDWIIERNVAIGPAGGPGGQGGDGLFWIGVEPNTVAVDPRGRPLAATADTAAGGIMGGFSRGLPGTPGTPGTQGADGVNGTWSLSAKGFVRGNGTAGGPGKPGQGGGGGGGTNAWFQSTGGNTSPPPANAYSETATGAGGGGGGCGGQPGTAGTGGGASVGAFIVASGVTIEQTRIESSAGGAAGRGNLGTRGTKGGPGGAGTVHTVDTTGKGGDGGPGGSGGGSGHGAAGPSIALVYSGARPILTGTELAPGPGGAGQPYIGRIVLGLDEAVVSAAAGESKQEHEIKP